MQTINASVTAAGAAVLTRGDERLEEWALGDVAAARRAVLSGAEKLVRSSGSAHRLEVDDLGTVHAFVLHPDGSRVPDTARAEPAAAVAPQPAPVAEPPRAVEPQPASAPVAGERWAEPAQPHEARVLPFRTAQAPMEFPKPAPVSEPPSAPTGPPPVAPGAHRPPYLGEQSAGEVFGSRREVRQSFLTVEQSEEPAKQGLRGMLTRVGIRTAPSEAERAERADATAVSQHWAGPRTIAIVNAKGGSSKTPTTVLLSAVFARYGGAGVLAWDNNQTRGTLGWRTEQGPHEATLLDLLPQVPRLLSTEAQSADLARSVHHQTRDRFDVLRSKPMVLAHEQRVGPDDVDAIHAVASKYYRLIFMDSGNDESDPMWRRMIDQTDQIVVATTTREDHAEAGALLLEALASRDASSARLARNAVVVVNQADPKATPIDLNRVTSGYKAIARDAVAIPHDAAMVDGLLRYDALRPATQRAWLAAAASVARGL